MKEGDATLVAGPAGAVSFEHDLGVRPRRVTPSSLDDEIVKVPEHAEVIEEKVPSGQFAFGVEGFDDQKVWGTIFDRNKGVPAEEGSTLRIHWVAILDE